MNVTVSKGNTHEKCKKNLFYCGGGQALEQIAQRVYGVSVCGDSQNPTRRGPGQRAPADPP